MSRRDDVALDDDAALLAALSDREAFERVLRGAFGLSAEEARTEGARLFYHYMDPRGRLLDRVVDEGDAMIFSREDRRDLVQLAKLGIVAIRSAEVVKLDVRGREKVFTQYHYAIHVEAIRQRLVESMGAQMRAALVGAAVPEEPDAEADVYADPALWARRRG